MLDPYSPSDVQDIVFKALGMFEETARERFGSSWKHSLTENAARRASLRDRKTYDGAGATDNIRA